MHAYSSKLKSLLLAKVFKVLVDMAKLLLLPVTLAMCWHGRTEGFQVYVLDGSIVKVS